MFVFFANYEEFLGKSLTREWKLNRLSFFGRLFLKLFNFRS